MTDSALLEEYLSIFGHVVPKDCPQYEAEYEESHIFLKSQTLADLSIFYEAFGVAPNPDLKDRLDHISVEMGFMNLLTAKEAFAYTQGHDEDKAHACREAQEAFLRQHLASWIKSFVRRLQRKAGKESVFSAIAGLLEAHIGTELASFEIRLAPSRLTIIPEEVDDGLDCAECPVAPSALQGV